MQIITENTKVKLHPPTQVKNTILLHARMLHQGCAQLWQSACGRRATEKSTRPVPRLTKRGEREVEWHPACVPDLGPVLMRGHICGHVCVRAHTRVHVR